MKHLFINVHDSTYEFEVRVLIPETEIHRIDSIIDETIFELVNTMKNASNEFTAYILACEFDGIKNTNIFDYGYIDCGNNCDGLVLYDYEDSERSKWLIKDAIKFIDMVNMKLKLLGYEVD